MQNLVIALLLVWCPWPCACLRALIPMPRCGAPRDVGERGLGSPLH